MQNMNFDEGKAREIDDQILLEQRDVRFETKEYTIELFVSKYSEGLDKDKNELFIPDYQRDDVWDDKTKSRFIESLLMGLPIPYIFTSDVENEDESLNGRIEVIDGSQRLRTLHQFIKEDFLLSDLTVLNKLNGCSFNDLLPSRKRRFLRHPIRVIELISTKEEVRRELFERINSGIEKLNIMEIRRGSNIGDTRFYREVVLTCSTNPIFIKLTPMSLSREKRREREEMVARFFAYLNNYQNFKHFVHEFVTDYFESQSDITDIEITRNINEFERMLNFVYKYFPLGFRKSERSNLVPRVRFESISVGTALALKKKPNLAISKIKKWVVSDEFSKLTTSDGSNSSKRVKERIEFVKNKLLGN
jgi:hypothetical protein